MSCLQQWSISYHPVTISIPYSEANHIPWNAIAFLQLNTEVKQSICNLFRLRVILLNLPCLSNAQRTSAKDILFVKNYTYHFWCYLRPYRRITSWRAAFPQKSVVTFDQLKDIKQKDVSSSAEKINMCIARMFKPRPWWESPTYNWKFIGQCLL